MASYSLRVNGRTHQVEGEPDDSLLSVLRYDLDLTGSKFGCGEGYCAAETGAQGICVPETQPGEACTGSSLSECAGDNGHCDMTIGQCVSCDRN